MTDYKEHLKILNDAAHDTLRKCPHKHPHKEFADLLQVARIVDDIIDQQIGQPHD